MATTPFVEASQAQDSISRQVADSEKNVDPQVRFSTAIDSLTEPLSFEAVEEHGKALCALIKHEREEFRAKNSPGGKESFGRLPSTYKSLDAIGHSLKSSSSRPPRGIARGFTQTQGVLWRLA
ncbi:unnamed protein product [Sympodiomycopsis kandeliae]